MNDQYELEPIGERETAKLRRWQRLAAPVGIGLLLGLPVGFALGGLGRDGPRPHGSGLILLCRDSANLILHFDGLDRRPVDLLLPLRARQEPTSAFLPVEAASATIMVGRRQSLQGFIPDAGELGVYTQLSDVEQARRARLVDEGGQTLVEVVPGITDLNCP